MMSAKELYIRVLTDLDTGARAKMQDVLLELRQRAVHALAGDANA